MTEAEWLKVNSLDRLLAQVRRGASDRKLRLLAVAMARRVWDRITFEECRAAVAIAEEVADGRFSVYEMIRPRSAARATIGSPVPANVMSSWIGIYVLGESAYSSVHGVSRGAQGLAATPGTPNAGRLRRAEGRAQCDLLRDLFGNPFRPIPFDPSWLSWRGGLIPELAGAIYEERGFDRMPYLGDALEEAGCDRAAILDHCRSGAEHARGCWVVDGLLGKD